MSDVIVIGGGIAGVSAAARLAPHGAVILLESEKSLGYHASGRSAAMFLAEYGNDVVRALNRASETYLHEAHGGVLSPRGQLLIAGHGQEDAFRADAATLGLDEIALDDARTQVPILNSETVAHVAAREDVFDLDTHLFLQNFIREARAAGARLITDAPVTAITREGGAWRVTAGGEDYRAATLVNAAGAWADEIAALAGAARLGLVPYRRSMALLPPPGGHDVVRWPFMLGAGDSWYAKPEGGRLAVSPCEEDALEPMDAWPDDMVVAEGLARYEALVTEPVTRVERSWAGLRTFAPDRALVIGPDPAQPAFHWLAGQGGYGFQTAAAASQLCADLVSGQAPELESDVVSALAPARFA